MSQGRRFTVALTGGVASGKSRVEKLFAALGVAPLDADRVARELVEAGGAALPAIRAEFGDALIDDAGQLDRGAMRAKVFADPGARRRLEAILHPRIRELLILRSRTAPGPYALVSVPLLAENRSDYAWVDRILVVDVSRATQLRRLVARDGIARPLAEAMIAAQASREARLAIADDVIDNEGPVAALEPQVGDLHRRYCRLAEERGSA